ncbi:DUF368 domain-containing protein [Allofustis seminis]|uniref:DUF368 domain-containing protein n=1 Tax=Allofustis seminis TaxID=166939 RepID=UPI00036CAD21|nr:DUF368 domain-containing protein [Allofustis seminis]
MNSLRLVIYGMLFGIANIIPGVSGGTMAASLGFYDELIRSISNLKRDWEKSLRFLAPLFLGAVLGLIFFSYSVEFLLKNFPLPTALAFIGLIFGGLPLLIQSFQKSLQNKKRTLNIGHLLIFALFFGVIVWMSYVNSSDLDSHHLVFNSQEIISLILVGMTGAAAMVIPGVSGSLVFMIFGYYYVIIQTLNRFFSGLKSLDINVLIHSAKFLFSFGVGVLLGIFLMSKLMEYLFEYYPSFTYSGILGLVAASPIAVLKNTQALANFNGSTDSIPLLIGLVIAGALGYMTYYLGRSSEK